MNKVKRSYDLPVKLLKAFDAECQKKGYVREAIVAAAVTNFLGSSPNARQDMFEDLARFLSKDK